MTDFDFTGENLIDRWQIRDFELLNWIKNGLQPHNEHGLKIVDPTTDFGRKIMLSFKRKPDFGHVNKKLPESMLTSEDETEFRRHLAVTLISGLLKENNCEADIFDIPANKSKGDALIRRMKKWLFITNDVFKFEKEHGLYKSSTIYPCDPGTKWEDVTITLVAHDMVIIKTPQGEGRFTYHKLEMEDKRIGDRPKKIWQILKLFAEYNGRLDSEIPESAKRILYNDFNIDYYKKLPDYTTRLNKHLQKIFGINNSIFKYQYRKQKAYITKIVFSDKRDIDKSDFADPPIKSLHTVEAEDVQDKYSIPDSKLFDA